MTVRTKPSSRRPMRLAVNSDVIDWRDQAACRGADPNIFFPKIPTTQSRETAQAFCVGCPVQAQCLDLADEVNAGEGVWGGVDREAAEQQRKVKRSYGSSHLSAVLDIVVHRLDEFNTAVAEGKTVHEIALQLGTNSQTVYNVLSVLENGEVGWEKDAPDEEVVRQYLAGEVTEVHPRERLAAVVQGVRSGMTYVAFDKLHGLPKQSTETFIRKARKLFVAAGVEFPDMHRSPGHGLLSDAEVVELRELCAAGVSTRELSVRFSLSQSSVRDAVRGKTYSDAGGPLRAVRGSSRVAGYEGGQAGVEAAA